MVSAGSVMSTAVLAVLQVFLACCAGFIVSRFPKPDGALNQAAVHKLSLLSYWLFIPCLLVTSLGNGLSSDMLDSSWTLLAWAPIHLTTGFLLGTILIRIFRPPEFLRREVLMACTFGNAVSIPLLFAEALVHQVPELNADAAANVGRGVTYVFVHSLVFNVCWWGGAAPYLAEGKRLREEAQILARDGGEGGATGAHTREGAAGGSAAIGATPPSFADRVRAIGKGVARALVAPPIASLAVGLVVGLVTDVGDFLRGPLAPVWETVRLMSTPAVATFNLVLAGSLYIGMMNALDARSKARARRERSNTAVSRGQATIGVAVSDPGVASESGSALNGPTLDEPPADTLARRRASADSAEGAEIGGGVDDASGSGGHSGVAEGAVGPSASATEAHASTHEAGDVETEIEVEVAEAKAQGESAAAESGDVGAVPAVDATAGGDPLSLYGSGARDTGGGELRLRQLSSGDTQIITPGGATSIAVRRRHASVTSVHSLKHGHMSVGAFPTKHDSGGHTLHELSEHEPTVSKSSLIVIILARLVLQPLICIPLFLLCQSAEVPVLGAVGTDPMLRVVLLLQFAVPPPTMLLLVSSQLENFRAASDLAVVFVIVYAAFTLSSVAAVSVIVGIVF